MTAASDVYNHWELEDARNEISKIFKSLTRNPVKGSLIACKRVDYEVIFTEGYSRASVDEALKAHQLDV